MSKTICTDCPERCILTENIRHCAKIGDKIWLHRNDIICRTCPKIEEICPLCTRTPIQRDELGQGTWQEISALLYEDYISRRKKYVLTVKALSE